MPAAVDGPEMTAGPHVTVVLVSHNGAKWLPQALDGLERQRRMPNALVAVDTGSTDESVDLLSNRVGPQSVAGLHAEPGRLTLLQGRADDLGSEAGEGAGQRPLGPNDPGQGNQQLGHVIGESGDAGYGLAGGEVDQTLGVRLDHVGEVHDHRRAGAERLPDRLGLVVAAGVNRADPGDLGVHRAGRHHPVHLATADRGHGRAPVRRTDHTA